MKSLLKMLKSIVLKIFKKYSKRDEIEKLPIFYINGSQTLPPPLNVMEEEKLLEKLNDNDQDAKQILVERNLRLVVYIAKKFENTGMDLEDLISIGTIGLMKAINTFNTDKNIKLATYASRCIENEILMYLRKKSKMKGEVSLDEPLKCDYDGNELLLVDILSQSENEVLDNLFTKEEYSKLHEAIDELRPREKEILSLRFGLNGYEELTQKETAEKLGISQSYISRLEKRIIKKLKNNLKENLKV